MNNMEKLKMASEERIQLLEKASSEINEVEAYLKKMGLYSYSHDCSLYELMWKSNTKRLECRASDEKTSRPLIECKSTTRLLMHRYYLDEFVEGIIKEHNILEEVA